MRTWTHPGMMIRYWFLQIVIVCALAAPTFLPGSPGKRRGQSCLRAPLDIRLRPPPAYFSRVCGPGTLSTKNKKYQVMNKRHVLILQYCPGTNLKKEKALSIVCHIRVPPVLWVEPEPAKMCRLRADAGVLRWHSCDISYNLSLNYNNSYTNWKKKYVPIHFYKR